MSEWEGRRERVSERRETDRWPRSVVRQISCVVCLYYYPTKDVCVLTHTRTCPLWQPESKLHLPASFMYLPQAASVNPCINNRLWHVAASMQHRARLNPDASLNRLFLTPLIQGPLLIVIHFRGPPSQINDRLSF